MSEEVAQYSATRALMKRLTKDVTYRELAEKTGIAITLLKGIAELRKKCTKTNAEAISKALNYETSLVFIVERPAD